MREKMTVSIHGGTFFEVPIIRKFSAFGFDFAVHYAFRRFDGVVNNAITFKKTFTVSEISTGQNIVYGYEFDRGPLAEAYAKGTLEKNGPKALSEAIRNHRRYLQTQQGAFVKKSTTITFNKNDGSVRHEGATEIDCPDGIAATALNKGMTPSGRLVITMDCNRACVGCANSFNSLMKHAQHIKPSELGTLAGHETIVITGGEPLLNIAHTEMIVDTLRALCPSSRLYLYTSMWHKFHIEDCERLISKIHGLTYTVHADSGYKNMKPDEYEMLKATARETDVTMFKNMQEFIRKERDHKSYRLYVDAAVQCEIPIQPNIWERVHVVPWMTEKELLKKCPKGVPPYETLYILNEGGV